MSATVCPPESIAAWSFTIPAPYQWATFDLNGLSGVPGLLSLISLAGRVDTYVNVSQYTTTAMQVSPNQSAFIANNIVRVYPQALIVGPQNCPLELDQGGLLTL